MTLVYLVISHRNPAQVLRLVGALSEGRAARVLVRHDERHSRLDPGELEEAGGSPIRDRFQVEWGAWSYLEMLLAALERIAREHDPDWVMLLSGQDYPVRPLQVVEQRLSVAEHDAFLGSAWQLDTGELPPPPAEEFFLRYAYLHLPAPRGLPHLPRRMKPMAYVRDRPPAIGLRRRKLALGGDLRCWVSSDWPTLGRRALRSVLRTARERPRLMRHYRRSVAASESFFATALMNDSGIRVSGDDRRFVRFAAGAPHPDVLTIEDLDQLTTSGAEFARKFDADVDGEVLDRLDEARRSQSPR